MKDYNALFNRAIEEKLGIKIHNIYDKCSYIKMQDALLLITKALQVNLENLDPKEPIRIRFSYDGRNISWGNVAFYLVPIDYELIFPPQLWKSAFSFIIYDGGECMDDYVKYCKTILDFTQNTKRVLNVDGVEFSYELFDNSDLKAVRSGKVKYSIEYLTNLKEYVIEGLILELGDKEKYGFDNFKLMKKEEKVLILYDLLPFSHKVIDGEKEKSENIKYEETEEFQVKKLNLIIKYLSETDEKYKDLIEKPKKKKELSYESNTYTLKENIVSIQNRKSNNNNKCSTNSRPPISNTPPKKKYKKNLSLGQKENMIVEAALADLKVFVSDDTLTTDKLKHYFESSSNCGQRFCHICCARTKHIKFSYLHPFYDVFQKYYEYDTYFNIEACSICILHAAQRMVEHTLSLTTQQNIEVANWLVIKLIIFIFMIYVYNFYYN